MPSTPLQLILEWRGKALFIGGPAGSAFYQCSAELEAALLAEDDAAIARCQEWYSVQQPGQAFTCTYWCELPAGHKGPHAKKQKEG